MDNIFCDICYHSEFAGYSFLMDSEEQCLLFNKQLVIDNGNTIPCEECKGKYFKLDE